MAGRDGEATVASMLPGIGRRGRIGVVRRFYLRRNGRVDGRLRKPDPLLSSERQVTTMRRRLLTELDRGLAVVARRAVERMLPVDQQLRRIGARITKLEKDVLTAEETVVVTEARTPDPTAPPTARHGDRFQSEAVIRGRRQREHGTTLTRARGTRDTLRQQLAEARDIRADLRARLGDLRRQAVADAEELRAAVLAQQALYDQALLRRHPDGELLAPLLDTDVPDVAGRLRAVWPDDDTIERGGDDDA